MAWKVLFQLLCPDIPNLDEFNKFQQKVIGYAHPQQTHDHQTTKVQHVTTIVRHLDVDALI